MNKFVDNKLIIALCLLTVVVIMGVNFIFIKFVLADFSLFSSLFFRLLLVAIILLPWVKKTQKKEIGVLILTSLILVPGHMGFLFISMLKTTNIASISVVVQLAIPFSVLLAWIIYHDNPGRIRLFGLAISFIGVVILFYDPAMFDNLTALVLVTFSALFLGSYYVLVKKITSLSPVGIIAYTSLIGCPFLLGLAVMQGEDLHAFFEVTSSIAWFGFAFSVVGSSLIGHTIWAWLVKHQNISFISPFLLLVPVVATALSALIFDEAISLTFVFSSSIILFGLFLVFVGKRLSEKIDLFKQVKPSL